MRGKFIIPLRELHAVFAHIRTIGTLITGSGIEELWMEAGWFDSDIVVNQVLGCKHMTRAIEAREATMICIELIKLKEMMRVKPDYFVQIAKDVLDIISEASAAISSFDVAVFRRSFKDLKDLITRIRLDEEWKTFEQQKVANNQFQFISL